MAFAFVLACRAQGVLIDTIDMQGPSPRKWVDAGNAEVLGFRLDYSAPGGPAWVGITLKDDAGEKVVATKSCKARQGMLDDCLIRVPAAGRYVVEAGIVWEGRGRSVDRARLEIRRMSRDTKE